MSTTCSFALDSRIFRHLPLEGVPEYPAADRMGVAELNGRNDILLTDKEFPANLPYLRRLDVLLHYYHFLRVHPNFPRGDETIKLSQLSLLEFRRLQRWYGKHEMLSTGECIQALVDERAQKEAIAAAIEKAKKIRGQG
jgi:hypothetical protein